VATAATVLVHRDPPTVVTVERRCVAGWSVADGGAPAAEMGARLPAVDLGAGRTVLSVSAGSEHTCALLVT